MHEQTVAQNSSETETAAKVQQNDTGASGSIETQKESQPVQPAPSVGSRLLKSLFKKPTPAPPALEKKQDDTKAPSQEPKEDLSSNAALANRIEEAQFKAKELIERQKDVISKLEEIWDGLQNGKYDLSEATQASADA